MRLVLPEEWNRRKCIQHVFHFCYRWFNMEMVENVRFAALVLKGDRHASALQLPCAEREESVAGTVLYGVRRVHPPNLSRTIDFIWVPASLLYLLIISRSMLRIFGQTATLTELSMYTYNYIEGHCVSVQCALTLPVVRPFIPMDTFWIEWMVMMMMANKWVCVVYYYHFAWSLYLCISAMNQLFESQSKLVILIGVCQQFFLAPVSILLSLFWCRTKHPLCLLNGKRDLFLVWRAARRIERKPEWDGRVEKGGTIHWKRWLTGIPNAGQMHVFTHSPAPTLLHRVKFYLKRAEFRSHSQFWLWMR